MHNIAINKCTVNQADEIKTIINMMWPSKTLNEIILSLQSDNEVIYTAETDGIIIAFIHGIIRNDYIEGVTNYPALYIEGVFVYEKYRNQNIASLLVDQLVKYGKEKNIKELASECRESNTQSYNWHIKNNFDDCQRVVHFIKNI